MYENETPETQTHPTDSRTAIQKKVEPAVELAITEMKLDLASPVLMRRYFRALVTIGAKRLLDAGAPPKFLVAQAIEALEHEIAEREAAGTAFAKPDPMEN